MKWWSKAGRQDPQINELNLALERTRSQLLASEQRANEAESRATELARENQVLAHLAGNLSAFSHSWK